MSLTLSRHRRRCMLARGLLAAVCVLTSRAIEGQSATTPAQREIPTPPPLPGVVERYADVPGARLFYLDGGGSGVPVVFMHAGTGSVRVWEHQVAAFAAAGFRFIAYDRRGYGRTAVDSGGPVGTAAGDLEALILHLGIDRFHLVGTAAGGGVSFDYALSFPHRLRSLTVANSVGNVSDSSYRATLDRMLPSSFSALPPDLRELGPSYRAANAEGTRRWLDLEHFSRAPGRRPPAQPARTRVTFAALESLVPPTLLITGDADLYTPPALLRLFMQRIRGAESLIVPEVGHSTYWERPELFNSTVIAFLRKH
ncbi:MAG: alpha/beta hydrolase [Gemmatimonadaceae bacterium]|nr:alpha/beta hydrolase [Gemmatimonadaceae bacterium]